MSFSPEYPFPYQFVRLAVVFLALAAFGGSAWADEVDDIVTRAETAYHAGDYDGAAYELSHIPGLLGVVPALDEVDGSRRARILFDLGRCYVAAGDSVSAAAVFQYLHRVAPGQRRGEIDVERDDAFTSSLDEVRRLRLETRREMLAARSPLHAALRSLVLPGWGQIYRGHQTRGATMILSTAALSIGWFIADRAYQSAAEAYDNTTISELNLAGRTGSAADGNIFDERYARVTSRARTANIVMGSLLGLWVYSVTENFFVAPGRVGLVIPID